MKTLYTPEEFNNAKSTDKLACECYYCSESFLLYKKKIKFNLKSNDGRGKYCSKTCQSKSQITKISFNCTNCNTYFEKRFSEIKKSNNHFCSKSCSTTYNNKNKTHGTRRSKLEIWIEEQLTILYPQLQMDFNQKKAIGSELDIHIPSLNIAFELNGIFHYEPIYGVDKLESTQLNDISKSKACHDAKIDLCVIDTSGQSYFKPSTSQKYLDIIINIINERLLFVPLNGTDPISTS